MPKCKTVDMIIRSIQYTLLTFVLSGCVMTSSQLRDGGISAFPEFNDLVDNRKVVIVLKDSTRIDAWYPKLAIDSTTYYIRNKTTSHSTHLRDNPHLKQTHHALATCNIERIEIPGKKGFSTGFGMMGVGAGLILAALTLDNQSAPGASVILPFLGGIASGGVGLLTVAVTSGNKKRPNTIARTHYRLPDCEGLSK